MKKIFLLLTLFISIEGIFISCTPEKSCEYCKKAPVALAGPDQIISLPTDSVSLDGSASNDPDGRITEWQWRKISGPAFFSITTSTTAKTTVKTLVDGSYQFELMVTDNGGLFAKDTVQITVNSTTPTNHAPVANAGPDQTITLPTNSVIIDGSGSTDPDNNITTYEWKKISGPSAFSLSNASSAQTQATGLARGVYEFELKVTDAGGLNDKDTVQVKVDPEINSSLNIYVAGMENNLPVYWKNGQVIPLDNISYGFTGTSIAVVDNDIYVAATKNELMWNDYAAKYWKNGQAISLGEAAGATSIAVAGTDVYVAGWKWEPSGSGAIAIAKYWKNGQPISLTNGSVEAYANSIVVVGSDIYVAGQEGAVAKYWKNGQAVSLTNGSSSAWANSIVVVGSDIYVAGQEGGITKYWKNGQAVVLPGANNATSIAVVDNDVYVSGYLHQGQGNSIAKYWKNGQEVSLTSGSEAFATSIAVFGNDVYVAGFEINFPSFIYSAKYWKNGQAIQLSNAGMAGSIVVVN